MQGSINSKHQSLNRNSGLSNFRAVVLTILFTSCVGVVERIALWPPFFLSSSLGLQWSPHSTFLITIMSQLRNHFLRETFPDPPIWIYPSFYKLSRGPTHLLMAVLTVVVLHLCEVIWMIATLLLDCKLCEGSNWVCFCFLWWKSFANVIGAYISDWVLMVFQKYTWELLWFWRYIFWDSILSYINFFFLVLRGSMLLLCQIEMECLSSKVKRHNYMSVPCLLLNKNTFISE